MFLAQERRQDAGDGVRRGRVRSILDLVLNLREDRVVVVDETSDKSNLKFTRFKSHVFMFIES
jgi:hypothetical protein